MQLTILKERRERGYMVSLGSFSSLCHSLWEVVRVRQDVKNRGDNIGEQFKNLTFSNYLIFIYCCLVAGGAWDAKYCHRWYQ